MTLKRQKLDHLDTALLQVKSLVPKTQEYLEEHGDELVSKYVITEIKSIAQAMNMPQGFVDGVGFVRVDRNTFEIVNRWGTKEKPLALWFNNGTRAHGPKHANVLHWVDKVTGKHIYAKWVRGVPTTHAMQRGILFGMARLKSHISPEIKENVGKKIGVY